MNRKAVGKILIAIAILVGITAVYRGFFYYPNDEVGGGASVLSGLIGWPSAGSDATDTDVKAPSSKTEAIVAGATNSTLPSRLLIPKLGINANVQALGVTKKGNMAAPSNFTDVSWYKYGTLPGKVGSAVMSGHEDNAVSLDGVFKHLEDLQIGDDVYVVEKNGTKLHFRVTDKKIYPYNLTGPELERVFNAKDSARLNLITCTGHWVQEIKTNDKRLVVFTELVD